MTGENVYLYMHERGQNLYYKVNAWAGEERNLSADILKYTTNIKFMLGEVQVIAT